MSNQPAAQPHEPPLTLRSAWMSDVGRARDHQEDSACIFEPTDPATLRHKGRLYLVADGMGGHNAGEIASQMAATEIPHIYYADPEADIAAALRSALLAAHRAIAQHAQSAAGQSGMGTTTTVAVMRGREVVVGNVGDSRAYLLRQGALTQITEDHSFVAEQMRLGVLTPEQARNHPQRNIITRALGKGDKAQPDFYHGVLQAGDVLLLCSDGLTTMVPDAEIQATVSALPPAAAVRRLIEQANAGGGLDNISVIVVRAEAAGGSQAAMPAVARPAGSQAAMPAVARPGGSQAAMPAVARPAGSQAAMPAVARPAGSQAAMPAVARPGGSQAAMPAVARPGGSQAAMPAVARPAGSQAAGRSRFPLWLMGAGAFIALIALIGVFLLLQGGRSGDAEPTARAGVQPAASATLRTTPTPTAAFTLPAATTVPPSATPPAGATATLAPSATATALSPTAQPTQPPLPVLVRPKAGVTVTGDQQIPFVWDWAGQLQEGQGFQVLIWKISGAPQAADQPVTAKTGSDWEQRIRLSQAPAIKEGGDGQYEWTVVLIQLQSNQRLSATPVPRRLIYRAAQQATQPTMPPILPTPDIRTPVISPFPTRRR